MKVKDLINKLQQYDQEAEVYIYDMDENTEIYIGDFEIEDGLKITCSQHFESISKRLVVR